MSPFWRCQITAICNYIGYRFLQLLEVTTTLKKQQKKNKGARKAQFQSKLSFREFVSQVRVERDNGVALGMVHGSKAKAAIEAAINDYAFGSNTSELSGFVIDLKVAKDLEVLEAGYTTITFEDEPANRWFIQGLGETEEERLQALLGEEADQFCKLVRKYNLLLPRVWLPEYAEVHFPILFTVDMIRKIMAAEAEDEKTRSSAFEWFVQNGKTNDTKDHGATYRTSNSEGEEVEVYDGDTSFDEKTGEREHKGPRLPYARYQTDHSLVGWRDNKSFCADLRKKGDVITYLSKEGDKVKVLDIRIAKVFPTWRPLVTTGLFLRYIQVAKENLFHNVVQAKFEAAMAEGGKSWDLFRGFVALAKEYKDSLKNGDCKYLHNGGRPVWVLQKSGFVLFSPVVVDDYDREDTKARAIKTEYWKDVDRARSYLAAAAERQAKVGAGVELLGAEFEAQLRDVRAAHKLIQANAAWFLWKELKPFIKLAYQASQATEAEVADEISKLL